MLNIDIKPSKVSLLEQIELYEIMTIHSKFTLKDLKIILNNLK